MIQRFDIQYISIWIHISISYISIFYIYISALYTIDVEIESARHPQVCPRNCFNTFPLTRPKDGPLPSGSQSCLENARGWFLVFDFHSKPGKWWPLPGYMEFHPPIYKYIDTYIYIYIWNNGNQSHVFQEFPIAMFDCRGYLNVENADRDWESPRSSVAGGLITQMVQAAFERCCFEYRDG